MLQFCSKDHSGCCVELGWGRKAQPEAEAVFQERVVQSGDDGDREGGPLQTGFRGTLGLPVWMSRSVEPFPDMGVSACEGGLGAENSRVGLPRLMSPGAEREAVSSQNPRALL